MDDLFDKDAFLSQRSRLLAERDRITSQIQKLDEFLISIGYFPESVDDGKITITEAIRRICFEQKTGLSKSSVTKLLLARYPKLEANDSTVAAILVTFAKSDPPKLHIEIKGSGRRGAEYGVKPPIRLKLNEEEANILLNDELLTGTGGWQSLFKMIHDNYESETEELIFPDSLKNKILHYCSNYGGGGFQDALKRALGRHVPEILK